MSEDSSPSNSTTPQISPQFDTVSEESSSDPTNARVAPQFGRNVTIYAENVHFGAGDITTNYGPSTSNQRQQNRNEAEQEEKTVKNVRLLIIFIT